MEESALSQKNRKLTKIPIVMAPEMEEAMDAKIDTLSPLADKLITETKTPEEIFKIAKDALKSIVDPSGTQGLKVLLYKRDKANFVMVKGDLAVNEGVSGYFTGLLKEAAEFEDEMYRGYIYLPDISKNEFALMTERHIEDLEVSDIPESAFDFYLGNWDNPISAPDQLKKEGGGLAVAPIFSADEVIGGIAMLAKEDFLEPLIDFPAVYELCDILSDSFGK